MIYSNSIRKFSWKPLLKTEIVFSYIFLVLITSGIVSAQGNDDKIPRWNKEEQIGQPLFTIQTYNRLSGNAPDGKNRVDVIAEVMYDMVQFVRDNDQFESTLEFNLSVLHPEKGQINRLVKHLNPRVTNYNLTNSRKDFIVVSFNLDLEPGKYKIRVELVDMESRRREAKERDIVVVGFKRESKTTISDLILARDNRLDDQTNLPAEPSINGLVQDSLTNLYCFFDLYRSDPIEPTMLNWRVIQPSGVLCSLDSMKISGGVNLSSYFIPIPCTNLSLNQYFFDLTIIAGDDTLKRRTTFNVRLSGLPFAIQDLNLAIQQLRYIATQHEIKRLLDEFPSRKLEAFLDFWNNIYKSESRENNSRMIEYYERISYANDHFGNNLNGWETDRGRIYVIYGEPTEIERVEGQTSGAQYEIWYYHHLGTKYVFVDEFGFGDYKIANSNW